MALPYGYPDDWIVTLYDNFAGPITSPVNTLIPMGLARSASTWVKYTYAGSGNVSVSILGMFDPDPNSANSLFVQSDIILSAASQNAVISITGDHPRRMPYWAFRINPGTASISDVTVKLALRNRIPFVS